jgi:hypothetical protein
MKNTLKNYRYYTSKHTNKDLHQQFFTVAGEGQRVIGNDS